MSPWYNQPATPRAVPLSYAAHLPVVSAAALKRIARLWVGTAASKLGKDACIKAICKGLEQPAAVHAMVQQLSDFERAGLGLVSRYGTSAPTEALATELLMLGMPFKDHGGSVPWSMRHGTDYRALNSLLYQGIVLPQHQHQGYGYPNELHIDDYHYSPKIFAESCVLAEVQTVPPEPLPLTPVAEAEPGIARQPVEVVLRLIGLVETLRKSGPIPLTTKGRLPKPFLTKLGKLLGWETALAQEPLAPLQDATRFFFWLLSALEFYQFRTDGGMELTAAASTFFGAPYETQALRWVHAYRLLTGWEEYRTGMVWNDDSYGWYGNKTLGLRAALLLALGALPEVDAWYNVTELSGAMFDRLGEYFPLGYLPQVYPVYRTSAAQEVQRQQEWRQQLQKNWERSEQPWISSALTGPLVHLGLVELAASPSSKRPGGILFRLTALGRAVLYDTLRGHRISRETTAPGPAQADGQCWIVQPNFDVVVYLDRAAATQLAFMERIAERKPASGATALYHLTRDTVYAALESGMTIAVLQDTLGQASAYPVPANVRQMLNEWAARRERLTVYRTAAVVEYPDQASRDAALTSGTCVGQAIGERFVVLAAQPRALRAVPARSVDYLAPPVRCLQVAEDGTVQIHAGHADLLIRGEVAAWADPGADDRHWHLTRASVERAVKAGWSAEGIIDSLTQRALRPAAPALLLVAIRAWAGERTLPRHVAVAADVLLQIADTNVAQAIASSTMLRPYLRGRLGPQTFLVHREAA
ncbi:MAG: hypothetical protein FJZ47_04605, partial [Candidatus Tectomicrobia bacterium]|nr:hypothetical protein [Candidatus Tectomicrobia bacterium]